MDSCNTYKKTEENIIEQSDFPKPGIKFLTFEKLLANGSLYANLIKQIADDLARYSIYFDMIAGLETRGYLFACPLATLLNKGFVHIRKQGKIPDPITHTYEKEYGYDTFEIPKNVVNGKKILILDDVLATGGSVEAAYNLIRLSGGQVSAIVCIVELDYCNPRYNLLQKLENAPFIWCPIVKSNNKVQLYTPENAIPCNVKSLMSTIFETKAQYGKYLMPILNPHNYISEIVPKILVATKSSPKLKGVYNFFTFLCKQGVNVYCLNVNSGINEQPIGIEEIELGLNNRLSVIKTYPGFDYYVSIENGILKYDDTLEDCCFSKIYNIHKKETFEGKSYSVTIPKDTGYVLDHNQTFGEYISKSSNTSKDDWYKIINEPPRWYMVFDSLFGAYFKKVFT